MTADIPSLTKAARRAIELLDLAKASGSPNAVGAARVELRTIRGRLERARAESIAHAELAKALAHPMRSVR